MSSFQVQLRQLKKNTRNRVSEVSSRISTEIADEAVLMQHRAAILSTRAARISARISSRALKGMSYHGDIPPPPPLPDLKEFEAVNPMYSASSTSSVTDESSSSFPIPKSDIRPVTSKFASGKSSGADKSQPDEHHDNVSWLAKKMSLRFSFRDLPAKDAHAHKPEMFSAPLPPLHFDDPVTKPVTKTAHDANGVTAERVKTNPLLAALLAAPSSPPAVTLNPKFEEYRMREFIAGLRGQFASIKPSSSASSATSASSSASSTTVEKPLGSGRSVKELRAAFSGGANNNNNNNIGSKPLPSPISGKSLASSNSFNNKTAGTPVSPLNATSSNKSSFFNDSKELKSSNSSSSLSAKPELKSVGSMSSSSKQPDLKATGSASSIKQPELKATGSSSSVNNNNKSNAWQTSKAPNTPPKVTLNESFEKYRMREFLRLQQLQQQVTALLAPGPSPSPVKLNKQFESFRHREFARVQQEWASSKSSAAAASASSRVPSPTPLSREEQTQPPPASGSLNRQPRTSFIIPPPAAQPGNNRTSTGQASSRVIKRTSGVKREDMPILDEDNQVLSGHPSQRMQPQATEQAPPRMHRRQSEDNMMMMEMMPVVDDPSIVPPLPMTMGTLSMDPGMTHIAQFPAPNHTNSVDLRQNKRGSFVSRAFKALSGTFGAALSAGSSENAAPIPPPPPQFPFSDFDLLQLDAQRAEQLLQFQEWHRLSTVYETRNEYTESVASDAARAFDADRRAQNMATL